MFARSCFAFVLAIAGVIYSDAFASDQTATWPQWRGPSRDVLSEFPYGRNTAVLHTDQTVLPKRRRAWASWNYHVTGRSSKNASQGATVTYQMNLLQHLRSKHVFNVTLNSDERIDPTKVLRRFEYHHPIFTVRRSAAQSRHRELINVNRTSFCGAYWGKQLANGLPPEMLRLSARVESLEGSHVRLATGETIEAQGGVVAVESPEAARLTGGLVPCPDSCSTTCLYFAADKSPVVEPILLLNGDGTGPVNNLCVPSNVAASYAAPGQTLVSVISDVRRQPLPLGEKTRETSKHLLRQNDGIDDVNHTVRAVDVGLDDICPVHFHAVTGVDLDLLPLQGLAHRRHQFRHRLLPSREQTVTIHVWQSESADLMNGNRRQAGAGYRDRVSRPGGTPWRAFHQAGLLFSSGPRTWT